MSQTMKVSALIHYLKGKIDNDLLIQKIMVSGEISNFTNHRSGHWYFTLKDDKSRISCVMFSSFASRNNYIPKDGDKVIIQANTSIFETSGQLQLYVQSIQQDGLGNLYLQYEKLKAKLNQEGLFDAAHKQAIPKYPMRICVITGKNTDSREDVVSTIARRWPIAQLSEFPVLVQGEGSSQQIIDALTYVDKLKFDIILLVRGGGSIEDLWSFNDESLARTIYSLKTPLISGVGHEVDITIVDYVADLRAPTPTGAAEMATPSKEDIQLVVNQYYQSIFNAVVNKRNLEAQKLEALKKNYVFTQSSHLYDEKRLKIDYLEQKLNRVTHMPQQKREAFSRYSSAFQHALHSLISVRSKQIQSYSENLSFLTFNAIQKEKYTLNKQMELLDAYSPLKVMKRGYAIPYIKGEVIHSINDVKIEDTLSVQLTDGKVITKVINKEAK